MFKKESITIALIIALITAIGLSFLFHKYNEQIKTTKIMKTYSTLSNIMLRIKADEGSLELNDTDDEFLLKEWFKKYFEEYLILKKVCYNQTGCWNDSDSYNSDGSIIQNNQTGIGIGHNVLSAIMSDGTYIDFDIYSKKDLYEIVGVNVKEDYSVVIFIDINGNNKPNTLGKDIFALVYTDTELLPAYKNRTNSDVKKDCSRSGFGFSCIKNYLK